MFTKTVIKKIYRRLIIADLKFIYLVKNHLINITYSEHNRFSLLKLLRFIIEIKDKLKNMYSKQKTVKIKITQLITNKLQK